jgi:hypothetical protein
MSDNTMNTTATATANVTAASSRMNMDVSDIENFTKVKVCFVDINVYISGEFLKVHNSIDQFLVTSQCGSFVYFNEEQVDFVDKENEEIKIFLLRP